MSDINTIFQLAKQHPFYADRYERASDFENAPTTDKATLYEVIKTALDGDRTFREGIYFSPTGGSIPDRLLYFPTDVTENDLQRQLLSPHLIAANIFSPQSILLNLFGSNLMYRALEIFNDFCERAHGTVLPVGSQCPDELALSIAARFGADSIIGNPSRILQFARHVESQAIPLKIPHIIFGGETLQSHKVKYLENALAIERISGIYGSAEAGIWAFKPSDMPLNCYLYPKNIMHIEIVEPDVEGFGRIVLTNLIRKRNPLCRYDCGDVGRVTEIEYRGETRQMLEFQGRTENSFSVGSEYYSISDFNQPFANLLEFQIKITFDQEKKRDRIQFRLVAPDKQFVDSQRDVIEKQIHTIVQTADELFITDIEFVEMSELERSNTAQKVVKIVDERS